MIHMLIERHIHEGQLATYLDLAQKALLRTYVVPGFVSGEAFADVSDANHRFLLCRWKTAEDWNRWANSADRMEILAPIHAILTQPERLILLEN